MLDSNMNGHVVYTVKSDACSDMFQSVDGLRSALLQLLFIRDNTFDFTEPYFLSSANCRKYFKSGTLHGWRWRCS
jgi:hypothetical protein